MGAAAEGFRCVIARIREGSEHWRLSRCALIDCLGSEYSCRNGNWDGEFIRSCGSIPAGVFCNGAA
jgi:hypothetical protein